MSKMVVTPRPPSTTGTITWLISSTSPACSIFAVEGPAALEHQPADPEDAAELVERHLHVDVVLAAEEIRDAGVLEVREVIVAHPLADQQDHVVALDVRLLEAQHALCVGADGEAPRALVGDVVGPLDAPARLLEPEVAAGELAHGGGADEPGADPEAVGGALEQLPAISSTRQRRPAVTEDAAVDGGAHVADDVELHGRAP